MNWKDIEPLDDEEWIGYGVWLSTYWPLADSELAGKISSGLSKVFERHGVASWTVMLALYNIVMHKAMFDMAQLSDARFDDLLAMLEPDAVEPVKKFRALCLRQLKLSEEREEAP